MSRHISLRARFLCCSIGLLLLLGAAFLCLVKTSLAGNLAVELQKRGVSIARHLANGAANPILTENMVELKLLMDDVLETESNVIYAFAAGRSKEIIAHTFGEKFPVGLVTANTPELNEPYRIQPLQTERGAIYDIAVPILKGELGFIHVGISGASIQEEIANIIGITIWIIIGMLLVGSMLAAFLATAITRPLAVLTQGVEAVGAGDLGQRIHLTCRNELGTLAESFNQMAENLQQTTVSRNCVELLNKSLESTVQQRTGALLAANESLKEEITRRKGVEAELQRFTEELEERVKERTAQFEISNRELEAFSYSVSHDLRAPLRHINAFSSILREEYAHQLDAGGLNYLQRICSASAQMGLLIDDLLDLSRVTRSEMVLEPVDLSRIAMNFVVGLQEIAPERKVSFLIDDGLCAKGDPGMLRIVMQNLLENAWKYSARQEEAVIEFACVENNGAMAFMVRDNGVGFDMAYVDKIYGAFNRLVRSDEFAGTGVGLAIVKRIIDRHLGRLWAYGEPENGAAFYFTLGAGASG